MADEELPNDSFLSEFIDDLYTEYDERLGLIRQDLLAIETDFHKSPLEVTRFDGILRHCHTLKGLAATVGLERAEHLIHHTESCLRALQKNPGQLSAAGMEILFNSFKCLEKIISAYRTQSTAPETYPVVEQLTTLLGAGNPVANAADSVDFIPESVPADAPTEDTVSSATTPKRIRLWYFRFTPTLTLARQGINVATVRARLEAMGTVIQALPQVAANQSIAFEFLISTDWEETHFANWPAEGITYTPYQEQVSISLPVKEKEAETEPIVTLPDTISSLVQSNTVRVELTRLDELMRLVGELVTTRARQANYLGQLRHELPLKQWRTLQETNLTLERQLRDLRENIMRVRLVPIGRAFERMKFVARDLANTTAKQIKLELIGQETEVDKLIVDKMIDPLLHLVRNAASHGIETPEQRKAKGKTPEGQIILRAYTAGDMVIIEVEDDGKGITIDRVREHALAQGLINSETVLEDNMLLDILCRPGFTTLKQGDLVSGRGIGMDVVKNAVTELGGTLLLTTQNDVGTHFIIQLPLTLAIADVLVISVAEQRFALPQLSVREIIEVPQAAVTRFENNEIVKSRDRVIPLIHLTRLFGLADVGKNILRILVVGGVDVAGIVVDSVIGKREIVVRALNDPLVQCPGISGASELGDGQVILILDVSTLVDLAQRPANRRCEPALKLN